MSAATVSRPVKRCALVGVFFCAGLAAACSSTDKAARPAELVKLVNRVQVTRVWRVTLSKEAPKLRLGLGVAVAGQRVFAATHGGTVEAFDLATGRRLWQRNVKAALAGGPGTGHGLVVVGSSKGEVIALSQADGAPRWRRRIDSEIISAPAVGDDLVVVRGVDGRLEALTTADGTDSWLVTEQVPRLSLRGTSRPILQGDLAICGFDDGHVVAVVRTSGTTAWSAAVDQPHGSSELQRLIDVDAPVVASGNDVFAAAYQGRVVRLTSDTGQSVWTRDLSSYRGLTVDDNAVYVSSADGELVRLDRRTGTVQWQQKLLARRELSAPVIYGGRVVVADFNGFVHWFDPANGTYLARMSAGKRRVSTAPVVAGGLLLVFTDGGELSAFRAPPAAASASTPGPAQTRIAPSAAAAAPVAVAGTAAP